ncbi:MAG: prepilin-type N-terminal cleavage/methylation domain-containing protein [Verrucomicrobia bacterium]|nr:prepilin-type N-terminal cleavage/methylation domain-containing protein [Verrucomicrobiota bacterium]MBU4290039.1 prepilin-type N-terminal cleavage/methylation domain-containing protein [Verrucomicrobiota bacterium]MBU4428078.1 prepilin-type N-terminal cleavage/methylation domain-containing protein [Verrucomicrobiota bacterium]MCG2679591.1 prepilin-type N-terminal cleavage/methylation domain-containing protein [Kiritimatiellia bacterium]
MKSGFTLLEALVALLVLVIVTTVVLETQITTLNLEQTARAMRTARMEIERIGAEVRLGNAPTNILATVPLGCEVTFSPLPVDDSENAAEFYQWDIVSQDRSSLKWTLITPVFY